VKVDAPLTMHGDTNQIDVYLTHRDVCDPKPVLLTLARNASLVGHVTGMSWDMLVDGVDAVMATRQVDRWWTDLVAFLRAEGVVVPPLPAEVLDPDEFLPVFRAVNRWVGQLWADAPKNLHFLGLEHGVDQYVRAVYKAEHHLLLTAGPITYGLRPTGGGGWEWWIAMGTGSAFTRVWVTSDDVLAAARVGGLPGTWAQTSEHFGDRDAVLERRRRYVAGASVTEAADWLSDALRELHEAGVLEPYFRAWRKKLGPEGAT
jgi:hypothetical protein